MKNLRWLHLIYGICVSYFWSGPHTYFWSHVSKSVPFVVKVCLIWQYFYLRDGLFMVLGQEFGKKALCFCYQRYLSWLLQFLIFLMDVLKKK